MAAPSTPSNFTAKTVSSSQIDLSWTASTGAVSYYRLERGDNVAIRIDAPTTSYSNTGLVASKQYSYRLWAFDSKGNVGAPTPWVKATTLADGGTPPDPVPPDPQPTPTDLFMGVSFQGLSLATPRAAGAGNWWQDVTGTDAKYGNTLPIAPASLWGGTATQRDSIQRIANALTDQPTALETDSTVPASVSNRVLVNTLSAPYSGSMQNAYLHFPSQSVAQGMAYQSAWCWLKPDLGQRGQSWLELVESKTPGSDTERFQLGIVNAAYTNPASPDGAHTPVFQVLHDMIGNPWHYYVQTFMGTEKVNADKNYGTGQTYKAPVPLGRWFRIEFAYNRNDSSGQGWMWFALTDPASGDSALQKGTQVFALRGAVAHNSETIGCNMALRAAKIDRIFLCNAYTNCTRGSSNPYAIKFTDVQLAKGWPSTATAHPAWS